jgi:hypothetical protein
VTGWLVTARSLALGPSITKSPAWPQGEFESGFSLSSGTGVDLPVIASLLWRLFSPLLVGRFFPMYVDILNAESTCRFVYKTRMTTNANHSRSMPRLFSRVSTMALPFVRGTLVPCPRHHASSAIAAASSSS